MKCIKLRIKVASHLYNIARWLEKPAFKELDEEIDKLLLEDNKN